MLLLQVDLAHDDGDGGDVVDDHVDDSGLTLLSASFFLILIFLVF